MSDRTIGGYVIQQEIGRGDVATVYVARQQPVERFVALKLFDRVDRDAAERLQQLARYLARLDHTNLVPVYDAGLADDQVYWIMRYMPAGTLHDRLKTQSLSPAEIDRLVAQIAAALDHAHGHDVFHGDLKPGNVLLDHAGNAFVADFGIVQALQATPSNYQAPEVRNGEIPDVRSDVYSLGAMIYELWAGQPLPPPDAYTPKVPAALEPVILKAVAPDPAQRYQSAGELAEAYAQARQHAAADAALGVRRISARREPPPRRVPVWALALIGLIVVIGGAAVLLARSPATAPAPTNTPVATASVIEPTASPLPVMPPPAASATVAATRLPANTPGGVSTAAPTAMPGPTTTVAAGVTPAAPTATLTATPRPTVGATRFVVSPTPTISITAFELLIPREDTQTTLGLTFRTLIQPVDAGPIGTLSMAVPAVEPYVIDRQLAQVGSGEQALRVSVRIRCAGAPTPLISREVVLTLRTADGQLVRTQTVGYVKRWCE